MRATRESLLFLGLLTAVCLLGGVIFGIATGKLMQPVEVPPTPTPPRPTLMPAGAASVTPGNQKSLLLIGITDTSEADSRLEACWVITFRSGVPEYYVLAFPPTATFELSSLGGQPTLTDIYAEDARLQLNHRFLEDALQARFPGLSIQTDLVLDRLDLAGLLNQLGGLPLNNQRLSASDLLATYDAWDAGTDGDRAAFDGLVMQAMFALLIERQWGPSELLDFVRATPRLKADPAKLAALEQFVVDAPSVDKSRLVWRVYGPEMEVSVTP